MIYDILNGVNDISGINNTCIRLFPKIKHPNGPYDF